MRLDQDRFADILEAIDAINRYASSGARNDQVIEFKKFNW